MGDRNHEIQALLRELADLSILDDQSAQSFRARAYERALHAIDGIQDDLEGMSVATLQRIGGIGRSTAQKIREYFDTGAVAKLETLRQRFPPSVVAMSRIPGVGPKTLARLRSELGIEDVEALRDAITEGKLQSVSGMGAKTEARIASAIDRLGLKRDQRTPIDRAMRLAETLVNELLALPGVQAAVPCGSLRRQAETVGDLDVVVASTEPQPIMAWFAEHRFAEQVIARGDTKTTIITRQGLQIDLRVVAPAHLGAATLYFTGSKGHNIRLRQLAIQQGWSLNEYALSDATTGEVVAAGDEASIYRALGLEFVPPPMREDTGEIEAALAGTLPGVVSVEDLCGDLHIHTDRSGDARSSLAELVAEAVRRGYSYLAITDHAEDLPINGVSRGELERQAEEIGALQEANPGLQLLRGCELNIDPDGGLDYDPAFRSGLDWCIAAVHSHFDLSQAEQTRRLIAAISDPAVRVIGHLSGRIIGERPGIEIDLDAILDAMVETGVALEINSALPRLDAAAPVLRRAVDKGVVFVISTDSHHVRDMGRNAVFGARQAQRGWVPREQVANTWPRERFLGWLHTQRRPSGPSR
ncbi:MAG TPA: DNA polymerase/3'-5' exonuclease PolX [Deltaproteobacteria bacterium]|nr:DNA polymerase/3'-5' exonuclease PolX [Deltaproteobacteria bacterium]